MPGMDDVLTAVDRAVEAGTFNLDAVRRVQELRQAFDKQTEQLTAAQSKNADLQRQVVDLTARVKDEEAVAERERAVIQGEWELKVKDAMLKGQKEGVERFGRLLESLTRNTAYRRQISGTAANPTNNYISQTEDSEAV